MTSLEGSFSSFGIGVIAKGPFDRHFGDIRRLFRNERTLFVFTDYAGQEKADRFDVYSILVTGGPGLLQWRIENTWIRTKYLRNRRRMAFKSLNDIQRMRALDAFLQNAGRLPGVCANFAVEKSSVTVFGRPQDIDYTSVKAFEGTWKPHVLLRGLTIAHLVGFLLSGLSSPGQDVIWISDDESFAANDDLVVKYTELAALATSSYLNHPLARFRFGTSRVKSPDPSVEDVLAIPDLFGGALADALSKMAVDYLETNPSLIVPPTSTLKHKTKSIMAWYEATGGRLRFATYIVRPSPVSPFLRGQNLKFHSLPSRLGHRGI